MRKNTNQFGASLAEFVIAAPIVMIVGMTTVQAGLIYHGKTTLNYATFEAARAGAVNNAQLSPMREALGLRLSPVQGGDGSAERAIAAIAKSSASVQDVTTTHLQVLNPTTAAFEDWGVNSQTFNQRVIPNNHLRHKDHKIGQNSGLSLRDANLLKIQVTYGVDMKVPVVGGIIARSMALIDPANAHYYARNKFPVSSVATVRMQSEAWEGEIVAANAPASAVGVPEESGDSVIDPSTGVGANAAVDDAGAGEGAGTDSDASAAADSDSEDFTDSSQCDGGEHGLGSSPVLLEASVYEGGQCVADPVFGDIPGGTNDSQDGCA